MRVRRERGWRDAPRHPRRLPAGGHMGTAVDTVMAALDGVEAETRASAREMEQTGRIPARILDPLLQAGVFNINVPRRWGGLEADPLVMLEASVRAGYID